MSEPVEELLGLHELHLPLLDALIVEGSQVNYVLCKETDLQTVLILLNEVDSEGWIHCHYFC
jgi:hypothetical protein